MDYDYNIRGWLTGINKGFANTVQGGPGSDDHYFGMELSYDQGFSHSEYNGNIAGSKWKSRGDGEQRAYGYRYDAANRLLTADFTRYTGGWNQAAGINFNVGMGNSTIPAYDANGNIGAMQQWGVKAVSSTQIDDLVYSYKNSGYSNRLLAISESTLGATNNGLGDFTDHNASQDDYDYDAAGSLVQDKNKEIQSITYNQLHLPEHVQLTALRTIDYAYDFSGNKLVKVVVEPAQPVKVSLYATAGIVYENNVLQFIGQEQGRIRPVRDAAGNILSYAYDYFIKDHLGNVRAVLTDEQQQDNYPIATLESNTITNEQTYYDNLNIGITTPAPSVFGGSSNTVQKLIKNAATMPAIGAARLLKVMATDTLAASVDYYYPSQTIDNGYANGLNTILGMLTGMLNGSSAPAALHGSGAAISTQLGNNSNFTTLFSSQGSSGSTAPKAYLNILFFDEQFRFVQSGSQSITVATYGSVQQLAVANVVVPKNGYAYIYVSNESNNVVYFDNLHVLHNRGPLLEETHYYPFGLTMAGISSKAAGKLDNKLKYNGKEEQRQEFSDGSGLELYDYGARLQDPQLGRWWTQDKFAEVYVALTPYQYAANNPIKIIDEAGHLLKDKEGNLIATSTGQTHSIKDKNIEVDGNSYRLNATFKEVVVYTDGGTPVTAVQMVSQYVEQQTGTDASGNAIYTPVTNSPVDASQNCHGTTFADAKLVVVDGEGLQTIVKEDGYITGPDVTEQNADAFIMRAHGIDYHSGKINSDGTVTSDHGYEKPKTTTLEAEKNAPSTEDNTKTTLYDRKGTDKVINTRLGKVTNGVRMVTQQQATNLRKAAGLKTTNQAKGTLKGTAYEDN